MTVIHVVDCCCWDAVKNFICYLFSLNNKINNFITFIRIEIANSFFFNKVFFFVCSAAIFFSRVLIFFLSAFNFFLIIAGSSAVFLCVKLCCLTSCLYLVKSIVFFTKTDEFWWLQNERLYQTSSDECFWILMFS